MAFPSSLKSGNDRMRLVSDRAFLVLKNAIALAELVELLAKVGLVIEDGKPADGKQEGEQGKGHAHASPGADLLRYRINGDDQHRWLRTRDRSAIEERLVHLEKALGAHLNYIAPVYQRVDMPSVLGLVSPQPDQLLVQDKGLTDRRAMLVQKPSALGAALKRFGLVEDEAASQYSRPYSLFRTQDIAAHSAYNVAPQLQALSRSLSVVFRVIPLISPLSGAFYPPDAEFGGGGKDDETVGNQWNLKRIGAPYAWGVTKGAASTVVYLLDLGADLSVTDMPTFTQFRVTTAVPVQDFATVTPNEAHGTAMLGLMGAPQSAAGMAGIAPLCTFVSLRGGLPIANTDLLHAINKIHADDLATPGQQLVFCIAAGACTAVLQDTANNDALNATLPADCVVCVPSGEYGTGTGTDGIPLDATPSIGYQTYVATQLAPHNVIIPNMLICGMTNQNDATLHYDSYRKIPGGSQASSSSKFGPELSVVAPGINVESRTPVSAGSSYAVFTGTSAATAHVAGIAALVRSNEAGLAGTAVCDRIRGTAAKTGPDLYGPVGSVVGPNQSRNDRMGHGRVDGAAVTVAAALGQCNVMIRDNPTDTGSEISSGWWVSDAIIVPASAFAGTVPLDASATSVFPAVTTAGSPLDTAFTNAVPSYTQIEATGDHYVFVRVVNATDASLIGKGDARCVRVTCVLAAISSGFMYPDWLALGDNFAAGICVPSSAPTDTGEQGYLAGTTEVPGPSPCPPIPAGGVAVFRFLATDAQITSGIHSAGYMYAPGLYHACILAMVNACNDVGAFPSGGDVRTAVNNLTQRNLVVV